MLIKLCENFNYKSPKRTYNCSTCGIISSSFLCEECGQACPIIVYPKGLNVYWGLEY